LEVLELATVASTHYWSKRSIRYCDAIYLFNTQFEQLLSQRLEEGPITAEAPYNKPNDETIRNWIRANENYFSWTSKYGEKEAARRFRGRGRSLEATRPLELVMFDHTRLDVWAVVQDENGKLQFVERPWLTVGIDCYSRMVLGAVLTYENPSIHSITECLRHVVRRKDELFQRYPSFAAKGATDGHGKPFTVIVDNGWEFTGTSFQTSCESANINVIWAPVKVPMFKAYVERLFGTMNEGIWHLLDGGIPLTPRDRSLLGLEPNVEAVHDRHRLEELLWQWIVTIYHMEVHSGIDMAPARKWREGIEKKGRAWVRDPRVFDKVIGFTKDCRLSAEGVFYQGERFHDPDVTTQLLSDIARHGKVREQRKGVTSSKTVWVMVTANPGNADHVHVRNPRTGEQVRLPNWNRTYAKGTTWYVLRKVREFAKRQNLAFHSDADRAAARVAFMEAMGQALPGLKFAEQRKTARLLDPRPELTTGTAVTITELTDGETVIHDLADEASDADRNTTKGTRRGGVKATEKSIKTRTRNRKAKAAEAEAKAVTTPVKPAIAPKLDMFEIDNAASRLKAITDRIKKENGNG
jgi:putative transposase